MMIITREDFEYLVQKATKAPSGHNTQPWLFRLKEDSIEVLPNMKSALGVVDPDNRELFISLGCATENLCIAATERGFRSETEVLENGIIRIKLTPSADVQTDLLAAQIDLRQTTRSRYDGRMIPADALQRLESTPREPGIGLYLYPKGSETFAKLAQFVYEGNHIQMQNPAFTAELKSWMRYNKRHQEEEKDGLSYAVFGAPNLPRFLAKTIMSGAINAKTQNKTDHGNINSSSHLVLFASTGNTIADRIALGRSLERFLLTATKLGIVHAYLNQPMETPRLSALIAQELSLVGKTPQLLLRIGYGKLRPYSVRKSIADVIL